MTALQEPFRYDYVGSFLRPEKVKKAKALYEDGKIEKEELDETINEAIREVVAKQKDLGFHVITDGEFRRTYWHLDFMWGFEGVAHEVTGGGVQFAGELASLEDTYVVGKIKAKAHPFVEYFKFLKTLEDENNTSHFTLVSDENYAEAMYHYQEAFANANTKERQAKVLRNMAKLQKNADKEASYVTCAELAEHYLTGKAKVRELLRLASDVSKPETKQALYESAANELIDSAEIKNGEKSLLLSNVIHNLRPLYGNDKTKLDNLDKLEKQYCTKPENKEFSLLRASSKGNDYFN